MTAVFLGYFDIIDDAQIHLYPAESATVNHGPGRKLSLVDLYRAFEGGWNLSDLQWISTSATPGSTPTTTP